MKVLFDIGHPAHVHYWKNLIKILKNNNNEVITIAREKKIIFDLLDYYEIDFISRGKGSNSFFGKILYMFKADFYIYKICKKNKPDLFISFASSYAAHVSYFLGKPHICFNDTEHTDKLHKIFTYPFSKYILTPSTYYNNLGKKHFLFNYTMESFYLNKNYFKPDKSIFDILNLKSNEKYVVIRFVSWNAHHDLGQQGINNEDKIKIIKILSKKYKVFISSEYELPDNLKKYELIVPFNKIHSVLYFSQLYIGESATMAAESAYFGNSTIYVNSLPLMSYLKKYQTSKTLVHFKNSIGLIDYIKNTINLNMTNFKHNLFKKPRSDNDDPNIFVIDFIKNQT